MTEFILSMKRNLRIHILYVVIAITTLWIIVAMNYGKNVTLTELDSKEDSVIDRVVNQSSPDPTSPPAPQLLRKYSPFPVNEEDILFIVISSVPTWQRAIASYNSWRRRTNATVLYFVADLPDNFIFPPIDHSLPQIHFITKERLRYPPQDDIVSLPVPEENSHFIVNKTVQALLYAAQHYPHKKWFYKCDDDTFVVPSNLKRLLQNFNSEANYYIGRPLGTSNINSGGAGYVLSRSALQAVKPHLIGCIPVKNIQYGEDMVISSCLESRLGIKATAAPGMYVSVPRDVYSRYLYNFNLLI